MKSYHMMNFLNWLFYKIFLTYYDEKLYNVLKDVDLVNVDEISPKDRNNNGFGSTGI